jgi:hypothetical protein
MGDFRMSIELLTNDHYPHIENAIMNAKNQIYIISPFIGFNTSKLLCEYISKQNVACTVITRFYREDFLNNASSIKGIDLLKRQGVSIYALKGLHTKLYLFDKDVAVLGSANFTFGGFVLNHELSLYIADEPELIRNLSNYYVELLGRVIDCSGSEVTQEIIDNEIVMLERLIKNRKDKTTKYSNDYRFGADLKNEMPMAGTDIIENIVIESINESSQEGIWLKFEGTGENRFSPHQSYDITKVSRNNKMNITNFPFYPASIKDSDLIYICAISWDKNGIATPMVVARARTTGANRENKADKEMLKEYPWMERYPYYIDLYNVEIINTDVQNCISLHNILMEVGSNTYPSTVNKSLTHAELRTRHYQKAYLRITPTAKSYIDSKFNELVKRYGATIVD